jgi:heterodisulfide reductase subunit B
MKRVSYYPGCALKSSAKGFENAARVSLSAMGVDLVEISDWNCCGVVSSLVEDDLIHHLSPVRNLIRAREQGGNTLITLCSMCYNTLSRANRMMRNETEKRDKINRFMYEEPDYNGEIEVYHLLNFLSQEIGWQTIREHVRTPLEGLTVAPYYGCMLTRPKEVAIEPRRRFKLLTTLLECMGVSAKYFESADRCCGSYQSVNDPKAAEDAVAFILEAARRVKVEALVLTCPLCEFNLNHYQQELIAKKRLQAQIPIYYFTQLLALSFGLSQGFNPFELHPAATDLLLKKGFGEKAGAV